MPAARTPEALLETILPDGLLDPAALALSPTESPSVDFARWVGSAVWDIVANNHDVIDSAAGEPTDLGSFRHAAGLIADFANRVSPSPGHRWCYLDFYLGTMSQRGDLTPGLYRLIFGRLRDAGFEWRYHHPRIYLFELAAPAPKNDEWISPSDAVARELAAKERAEETARLRESLDEVYRLSVEDARANPPPTLIVAYRAVYGHHPDGWPPPLP
ncbi:MAG: hypothetical protein ACKVZ0_02720 [Gemmatimonadales bacterium]